MRSYQGFVCLMQLSTRTENFLVDTLALRNEMQRLQRVFTNPSIVKVLHGADWDVQVRGGTNLPTPFTSLGLFAQWLQRDFSLYIVNMFDTGQAARVLKLPKKSLAYLLDFLCSVKVLARARGVATALD